MNWSLICCNRRKKAAKKGDSVGGILETAISGIPGEEDDNEDDLQPLVMTDNGDTSADGADIVNSDESMGGDGTVDLV